MNVNNASFLVPLLNATNELVPLPTKSTRLPLILCRAWTALVGGDGNPINRWKRSNRPTTICQSLLLRTAHHPTPTGALHKPLMTTRFGRLSTLVRLHRRQYGSAMAQTANDGHRQSASASSCSFNNLNIEPNWKKRGPVGERKLEKLHYCSGRIERTICSYRVGWDCR